MTVIPSGARDLSSILAPPSRTLPLAELEPAPRTLLSVLLAFFHARIAREKTILAQRWPQFRVQPRKRARKTHAHRSRLSTHAAALHNRLHLDLVKHLRELEGLDRSRVPRHVAKIFVHWPAVHREPRRALLDIHACD